ncbi:MAG: hypothetical protein WA996_01440 [Candidatus Promineifilaceae bacterium]
MVSAVVLLTVERRKINYEVRVLAGMVEISQVNSVAGQYDLVAVLRASDKEALKPGPKPCLYLQKNR